jgi:hypothetical protein
LSASGLNRPPCPAPHSQLSLARNAVWTLSNLCRGKTPAPDIKVVMRALPVLARYIFSTDQEILQDAAWALSFIR